MDSNAQQQDTASPVVSYAPTPSYPMPGASAQTSISPLAMDPTYGEKIYNRIFGWGINYWANLMLSAGFSQYAEHSQVPIKVPFVGTDTPAGFQQKLANFFKDSFWMKRLHAKILLDGGTEEAAKLVVEERCLARARSAILLGPGFPVVIFSVWLGAKMKPWVVEYFDNRHYGADAANDPSLHARHEAIRAEERPTLLGTITARMGTVVAAQATAQAIGSDKNFINTVGKWTKFEALQEFKGVDGTARKIGNALGGAMPEGFRLRCNRFAKRVGLSWSQTQSKAGKVGDYTHTVEDFGGFAITDMIYTMVTAVTIQPILKLLRKVPFMTYKPEVAANSAVFDEQGDRIKVPVNRLADYTPDTIALTQEAANAPQWNSAVPGSSIRDANSRAPLIHTQQQLTA